MAVEAGRAWSGALGGQVSGWRTRVYEATGRLAAVSIAKAAVRLPEGGTFEEYCAMSPPRDARKEARPSFPPLPPPPPKTCLRHACRRERSM